MEPLAEAFTKGFQDFSICSDFLGVPRSPDIKKKSTLGAYQMALPSRLRTLHLGTSDDQ